MSTQKSSRVFRWSIVVLSFGVWAWLSISPEHAINWVCGSIALVGLVGQCTLSHGIYAGLCIILMWCLAYTNHERLLVYPGIFLAALGPVSYAIQVKDKWNKACLLGACWLWIEYIKALSIVSPDVYMVLRKCVLPVSVCACWLQYPQWSVRLAAWRKDLGWGMHSNMLIVGILAQFLLTWSSNMLDRSWDSGLNCKHRILWMGICVIPVLWKLFDLKKKIAASVLTIGLGGVMYSVQSRLGFIALVGAFFTRFVLLTRPKLFFTSVTAMWCGVTLSTVFWFQYCLNHPVMMMVGSLNSSFYERIIFWRHFEVYADEMFWWGYGIPGFLRLLFKPLTYEGIDKKMLTILPSHTHWVWLDLRLSIGCVGVGITTILLLGAFLRCWHDRFTPQQATKIATLVYVSTLYTSFYGLFWHVFVVFWVFFSWLMTDFLYQNVLRGTEESKIGFRSTWNNTKGVMYAEQKK